MARTCTSGNYLEVTPDSNIGDAGTVFLRFKPSWSSGEGVDRYLFSYSDSPSEFSIRRYSDNNIYAGRYIGGADARIVISDSGLFSSGVWANWLIDYDATADLTHLYVDDVLKGTSSSSLTMGSSFTLFTVGNSHAHANPANGDIAEVARWDHVLTAAERAVLQASGCPLSLPSGLVHYHPLIGRNSPEIEPVRGQGLSLTGTPAAADHPRTFLPYHADWISAASSAAALEISTRIGSYAHVGDLLGVVRNATSRLNARSNNAPATTVVRGAQSRIASPAHIAALSGVIRGAGVRVGTHVNTADRLTAIRQAATAINARSNFGEYVFVVVRRISRIDVNTRAKLQMTTATRAKLTVTTKTQLDQG